MARGGVHKSTLVHANVLVGQATVLAVLVSRSTRTSNELKVSTVVMDYKGLQLQHPYLLEHLATSLLAGAPGNNGTATIHVQRANGSIQEYTSCYRLELVDFDIEDENQDGIFEPGEHLFIRRISVRNTGLLSPRNLL
jgi:hypothetical protein